tara:strand:- start:492 stop:1241 length:750 start_codon:yes stop_codon:yes gene_type:complete
MIKFIDFNVKEPYRDGNRTDLTWETFQQYRDEVKISKKYNDYLRNKSIVIVGPSPYLVGKKRGKFIDSHDIVIRMNKGWKPSPDKIEDYGSKTTIRYHCMMEHPNNGGDFAIDDMIDYGVEWLVSQFPRNLDYFHYDNLKFEEKNQGKINFHCCADLVYFLNIHRALETRPNVAPSAIFELINYDIGSLHLMGCTFLKDGWLDGYKKDKEYDLKRAEEGHTQAPQIHLVKLILENEPKFTMDQEIIDII